MNYFLRNATSMEFTHLFFGCVTIAKTMKEQGYPASNADGFGDGYHSGKNYMFMTVFLGLISKSD